jgi:23S rRNA-/tRNA-specific pseudouridylate synthase
VSSALLLCPSLGELPEELRPEAGLLHRLDNDTSGVLLFAKNLATHSLLRELWKTGEVRKIYRAIAGPAAEVTPPGWPALPLEITDPIFHSAKSPRKMVVDREGRRTPKSSLRGKPQPAVTRLLAAKPFGDLFDLTIQIETGVRHQIRTHLSAWGLPIAGDLLYRGVQAPRLCLHAWKLEVPLPGGTVLSLTAQLPAEWPALSP